ncbi:MAG: hypothetical protein ACI92I_000399 [Acidimicrobiales bacterium]|jgi:hypothetical protein
MEKRLNFNKEVDDLTRINEFFQNYEIPTEIELLRDSEINNISIEFDQ